MDYKDYYAVLGVPEGADEKTIRKAFRKLARQYHPDANPDNAQAEQRFKEISEAYDVLSNPEKREKYEELRQSYQTWQRMGGRQPGAGGFDWSQWAGGAPGGVRVEYGDAGDFSDFFQTIFGGMGGARGGARGGSFDFEDLFGGRGTYTGPARGQDLQTDIEITLDEAYHGTTRLISKDGRRLQVKIPRGARTGTKVRIAGEGSEGAYESGDLYLHVHVINDDRFRRENDDLYVDAFIDLYTAILGGEVSIPTMTGRVTLKVNPGTQPGQLIRVRGRGMPLLRDSDRFGDLFVRVHVDLPTNLSEEERELFEELASLNGRR